MLASSGCYYGQLAVGQCRLLWQRQPIERLLADPSTPETLRGRLRLVEHVRDYGRQLGLDVGGQYTSYVPWPGDRVLTTLVATRPGEVDAAGFDFPVVGRLPYKGFFDREAADREAADLRGHGLDVCVSPVRAYSTLGWLADPLTEPMLRGGDPQLIETVLHELVHATAFVPDDASFNEGVANFFGREATARYLAQHGLAGDPRSPDELAALQRARTARRRAIARRMHALREDAAALYASASPGPARVAQRAQLTRDARRDLAAWAPPGADAERFASGIPLADACLALRGTYTDDAAQQRALLAALGDDLPAFVAQLVRAADSDAPRETFFAPLR